MKLKRTALAILAFALVCGGVFGFLKYNSLRNSSNTLESLNIPEYSGQPYVVVNNNEPFFEKEEMKTKAFEKYSDLDKLGRCGVAYANLSRELMPTESRGNISNIKPTGWQQKKYEGIVDSKPPYLYNRCHLIAYCLAAEN